MSESTLSVPNNPLSWQQYLEICKPKVVLLIVFTAIVGMFLSSPTIPPLDTIFFASLGIGLAAASGAATGPGLQGRR